MLAGVAVIAVLTSPLLAVYELLLAVALIVVGATVGRHRRRDTVRIGVAILAGPVAYAMAWLSVQLFD